MPHLIYLKLFEATIFLLEIKLCMIACICQGYFQRGAHSHRSSVKHVVFQTACFCLGCLFG